jgi:hypothetical protein
VRVRFGSARYSVPVRLIGEQVRLRTDDGRLLVIMTTEGHVVAEHFLVAPGEASVRDEHYGGPRPAPRRAVRPKTTAEKDFCALGPVAEAFITGAAAAGSTRLGSELAELNSLRAAHGDDAFEAALDRAVVFCRWRAADVRSILAAGVGAPSLPRLAVKSPADHLAAGARRSLSARRQRADPAKSCSRRSGRSQLCLPHRSSKSRCSGIASSSPRRRRRSF